MNSSLRRMTALALAAFSGFFTLAGCVLVVGAFQDDPAEDLSLTFALTWLVISGVVFAAAIALARSDPPPRSMRSPVLCGCGYLLIGLESGRCPECGEPISIVKSANA